jgi:hypothetical protein
MFIFFPLRTDNNNLKSYFILTLDCLDLGGCYLPNSQINFSSPLSLSLVLPSPFQSVSCESCILRRRKATVNCCSAPELRIVRIKVASWPKILQLKTDRRTFFGRGKLTAVRPLLLGNSGRKRVIIILL